MQSMAHKREINLSAARPKIKTDSQPLYLKHHHWQPKVALSSPTRHSIRLSFHRSRNCQSQNGIIQAPHFTDEVSFEAWFQVGLASNRKALTFSRSSLCLPGKGYFNMKVHVLLQLPLALGTSTGTWVSGGEEVMSLETPGKSLQHDHHRQEGPRLLSW